MASFLDALNKNTGAISAITTSALVLITFWYAFLTRQSVQATRKSQRPYLAIELAGATGTLLEIAVVNFGERTAERCTFEVRRDVVGRDGERLRKLGPFANGIAHLPPGRGYRWRFHGTDQMFTGPRDQNVLDVTLSYFYGGERYEETVVIDFADFEGVLYKSFASGDHELVRAVTNIARELERTRHADRGGSIFRSPCPSCREDVSSGATKCPHCLESIPPTSASGTTPGKKAPAQRARKTAAAAPKTPPSRR